MDIHPGRDFYDSFIEYQSQMLKVFDRMSGEYGFHVLDASRSINRVAATLRSSVARVIDKRSRVPRSTKALTDPRLTPDPSETPAPATRSEAVN